MEAVLEEVVGAVLLTPHTFASMNAIWAIGNTSIIQKLGTALVLDSCACMVTTKLDAKKATSKD